MSLITYNGLVELVEQGVIEGVKPEHINAASIDVTLGDELLFERASGGIIDLAKKQTPDMGTINLIGGKLVVEPGDFCLGHTREVFNLPNDIACEFKLKSSLARAGLNHMLAGWCDPGWNGSVLTIELHNVLRNHDLILRPGMKIGQMVFFRGEPVPDEMSYAARGQYNGDKSVSESKGVR